MQLRSSAKKQLPPTSCLTPTVLAEHQPCTYASTLPTELLLMVFQELHKQDLKPVRLVSRLWNEIATELLFDQIYISHRQKDMEVFNAWTANAKCSSYVKRLIYDASFLDPAMKVREYAQHLCEQLDDIDPLDPEEKDYKSCDPKIQELFYFIWGGKKLNKREQKATTAGLFEAGRFKKDAEHWMNLRRSSKSRIWDFDFVNDGFAEYIREARLELDVRHSGDFCVHLTRGLERLPRLRSVVFWEDSPLDRGHWTEQFDPLHPKSIYLSGPPFIRSWNPLYVLPRNRLHELADHSKRDHFPSTQYAIGEKFEACISALALSRAQIAHLNIDGNQFHCEPFEDEMKRDSILSRNMKTVCSRLESLRLSVDQSEMLPERERFCGLQPALAACVNLVYLSLSGTRNMPKYDSAPKCVFTKVLPRAVVLKKLRTLKLHMFHFKAKHLAPFLRRHRLEELVLHCDVVRVKGNDHMADVRTVCKAVSSVPNFNILGVETMGFVGEPGEKFLVLASDVETKAFVVKLGEKDWTGLSSVKERVVDLNEPWEVVKEYQVSPKPEESLSETAMIIQQHTGFNPTSLPMTV